MKYGSLDDGMLRQVFQSDHPQQSDDQHCLTTESIWEAVAGKYSREMTLDMVNHTATCPTCAQNWRLAREIQQNVDETAEVVPIRKKPFRLLPWSLAAAAMLILGLWATFSGKGVPDTQVGPGVMRAGEQITITAGMAKGMHLNREACLLQWSLSEETQVSEYRLRVTTSDPFDVVADVVVQQPRYRIPAEDLERLPSKTALLWRVTATVPQIGQIHSETFTTILE